MPQITVLNQEGKALHQIDLVEAVFGIEPNQQAIFDTVLMQRASLRQGTHDVKTRREVRGGGRKPWRQKGTGRARQGSIRSPQWRGGACPRSNRDRHRRAEGRAVGAGLDQRAIGRDALGGRHARHGGDDFRRAHGCLRCREGAAGRP